MNLDPALATQSSDTEVPSTPVASQGLSTGSNNLTSAGAKATRKRRTKREMEAYRVELAKQKEEKRLEQERAKAEKERKKQGGKGSQTPGGHGSQSSQSSQSQSQSDSNAPFTIEDYELICSYLEVPENYSRLYGSGDQTDVGPRPLTKTAAYEMFAIYLNSNCNKRYKLTGAQLRQRIDRYKKKFTEAKKFAENTGAGIEEEHGVSTLRELLNEKCPCYERMDAIFGAKPNVTPCMQYDSVNGSNLYGDSDGSSPEVIYSGWEESQRDTEVDSMRGGDEASMRGGDERHSEDTTMGNGDETSIAGAQQIPDSDEELPADLVEHNLSGVDPAERGLDQQNPSTSLAPPGSNPARGRSHVASSSSNRSAGGSNAENTPNSNPRLRNVLTGNNEGPPRPPSQGSQAKSTLAGAFERTTDSKLGQFERQVDRQMSWEREKFGLQKEKDLLEHKRLAALEEARDACAAQREEARWQREVERDERRFDREYQRDCDRLNWEKEKFNCERQERMGRLQLLNLWTTQGKSIEEIERMMKLV
ncbi:hypothetical protein PGT21_016063 [Puccinia graminis f. sp. tritici]|uniref:Uncharacterized protein n=1 Tax=Puccinia graminis f. sp. tritici TaxID=56615 RepID=A0A5B0NM28_PUCGR|nr:hypothetical protein PGT21_016063 [Puccinia graminis f. sp. tritici]KAA1089843.1 hypothetical protein PGTUg99_022675 [Puccinia graminis f. sp. tritici]